MRTREDTPRRGDAGHPRRSRGAIERSRDGGEREAFAALQRRAGNAAAARVAIEARAVPSAPLLQRKVGFEAELMVPSIGRPHGTLKFAKGAPRVSAAIASFLDGGVPYGTKISTQHGPIRIDSDHGKPISRKPIVDILERAGYVTGKPTEPRTKLEFVTKAVDELAPGSDAELAELKKELEKQLSRTLGYARSGKLMELAPPAKDGYFTGVPMMDFRRWLQGDYRLVHDALLEFRDKKIADQVYLQATVGVIPSAVRTFMRRANAARGEVELEPPGEARKQLIGIVSSEMHVLEEEDWFEEHPWVEGLGKAAHEAFMGMLWLTYSYLLGDTLHRTSAGTKSTAKNAVPFLIKSSVFDLTARAGPATFQGSPPPEDLARKIADWCETRRYLKRSYWIGKGPKSAIGKGKIKKPIRARKPKDELITGKRVDFVLSMLTEGGDDVTVMTGKRLPALDALPEDSGGVNVDFESFAQEAIPMEYRWIAKKYKIGEVAGAIDEIVAEVRKMNMRHLAAEQRRAVRGAF